MLHHESQLQTFVILVGLRSKDLGKAPAAANLCLPSLGKRLLGNASRKLYIAAAKQVCTNGSM